MEILVRMVLAAKTRGEVTDAAVLKASLEHTARLVRQYSLYNIFLGADIVQIKYLEHNVDLLLGVL